MGVIILGALSVWYGIRFALNTEYPVLVVSSGSMCLPTNCVLPIGALIVIHGQDPSSISVGEIIVFRPDPSLGDYLVVHRVFAVFTPSNGSLYKPQYAFETHGDNNPPGPDPWGQVPGSRLVGLYQFTVPIPYLGSAILDIRQFMYGDSCDFQQNCRLTTQGLFVIVLLVGSLFAFEIMEPSKKPSSKTSTETKSSEASHEETKPQAPPG